MGLILVLYHIPILVSSILSFLLGWLWYHPAVFGTKWAAEQTHRNMPDDFQAGMRPALIASALDAVLTSTLAITLFIVIGPSGVILLGLFVCVGSFAANSFKGGTRHLWLIDVGYMLARLILAIAVLMGYFAVSS